MNTIYTIGYASLDLAKFKSHLDSYSIDAVCDVRSVPFSRGKPDFNAPVLKEFCSRFGIAYVPLCKELGARPSNVEVYIDGCVSYERLAQSREFQKGLARVTTGAQNYTLALMCAEKDPITCHRTILVSRHLVRAGFEVDHILANGRLESHTSSMNRLLKNLGLERKAAADRGIAERAAYLLQGKKLAYCDPNLKDHAVDLSLPGVI